MESLTNFNLKFQPNQPNHNKYINYYDIISLYDKYNKIYHLNYMNSIIIKYNSIEEIYNHLENNKPKKMIK